MDLTPGQSVYAVFKTTLCILEVYQYEMMLINK
ncbi:MAG: hypothetical protein GX808_05585 [Syntrophomonadaceae bacterium]|nr:hypothetical protein [Syntrophomonadaceae bacterium]